MAGLLSDQDVHAWAVRACVGVVACVGGAVLVNAPNGLTRANAVLACRRRCSSLASDTRPDAADILLELDSSEGDRRASRGGERSAYREGLGDRDHGRSCGGGELCGDLVCG